ncbi:hypothetical protein [Streptomyces sp. NPDC093589]|uniref:hypothetical protein n=1 Tax=Streptomyces sp. NPDC093589 TaxID=3366043 RepID=UPI003813AB47
MSNARYTDPELQALYDYLAPTEQPRAVSAEAIAAREGLNLAAELAALRRRPASPARQLRQVRTGAYRGQRALQDHVFSLLRARATRVRPAVLRAQAASWAELRIWPHEAEAWIAALGADGAANASACLRVGIGLPAMDIVLDGQSIARRLRGGETPTAVHARAAALGIILPG